MHLILSSLANVRTSLIYSVWDGGVGDFHLNNIKRLARRVPKAVRVASRGGRETAGGVTPNNAIIE